jgi:hypothetical protein
MTSRRDRRWEDFRRRADDAPESVYRHRVSGWEYMPIHPFADEPELLARLNLRAEDCRSVDAWWGIARDATLMQTCISKQAPGLQAHGTVHDQRWIYLNGSLDVPSITRVAFEEAMSRFVELGFPSGALFQLQARSVVLLADDRPC